MRFESLDQLYRYAKKKYKITYSSIAKELGKSSSFICMSIAGTRPIKPESYDAWIKALNVESDITHKEFERLTSLAKTKITLDLSKCTDEQKEIVCSLANAINTAKNPDHAISQLKEVIK